MFYSKGNKYGQYLAAIQMMREERRRRKEEAQERGDVEEKVLHETPVEDKEDDEDSAPVGFADGRAHRAESSIWAAR